VNQLAGGETLASVNGAVAGNGTFAGGDGGLRLSTPGLNNFGYVDVQITAPDYLQYNWNGAATAGNFFDDNPGARATFGKYKQRNELIYMREIH
jgi:MSHA biogenesis protein MshQ